MTELHYPAFHASSRTDNDEITLESRSSELLLRNEISDISEGQQWVAVTQDPFVLGANVMSLVQVPAVGPQRCRPGLFKRRSPRWVGTLQVFINAKSVGFPWWWHLHTSYAVCRRQNLRRWTHWCCLGDKGKTRCGEQQSERKQTSPLCFRSLRWGALWKQSTGWLNFFFFLLQDVGVD